MKHKLIVTLIATALELYGSPLAQAACLANGATPVTSGPVNPIDGFPEYVTDSNGLSMQRCLDPDLCFFDPIVATDPFSVQIRSGGEAFYWAATATLRDPTNAGRLTLVMAAETAFLQDDPVTGAPIDGSQFPFLRLRLVFKAPLAGNYTLVHPYGTETFTVDVASGGRDVFNTIDRGFAPSSTFTGPVGPFLIWDTDAPAGFAGNGGATGALHTVTGSPCGVNSVTLTGKDFQGRPLNLDGLGGNELATNEFDVQGQYYDGRVQTPLNPTRLTYSRAAGALGQIDTFATSTANAVVTVQDGPTIPAGSSRLPNPVTLARTTSAQGGGLDFASTAVTGADTDALPAVLSVTATETGTNPATDPTTLIHALVDFVKITSAEYDPSSQVLLVNAESGDQRVPPTLTLREYNQPAGVPVNTAAPPASVTVVSSHGGSDTALVRVVASAAPLGASNLAVTAATSSSISLSWRDNASNETRFDVYRNGTLVRSLGANATSLVDTGLTPSTTYAYQVFTVNLQGQTGSPTLDATTLALPVTPTIGTASATPARTVTLTWTDNSADETGFRLLRSTTLAGTYTQVGTALAGATSGTDTTASPNTQYFYKVVAVRGTELSTPSAAASLTTPATPSSPGQPTLAAAPSGTQVTVTWADRSTNENAFQVYRRIGTGAFSAVSGLLASNSTSYVDSSTTPGTTYTYRVDVSNWAGTLQSALSAALTTPSTTPPPPPPAVVLNAPTGLSASTALQPVLNWTDTSTGETAYRVRRTAVLVNANGSVTTSAPVVRTSALGANTRTYTDTTATGNSVYLYDVAALNGATVGALASAYTVATAGGLTVPGRPTLTRSLVGNAARVAANWTLGAPNTGVGGFELQRCAGVGCTSFAKVSGTAVRTAGTVDGRATLSFTDTTVARATSYTYRLRSVGGAGTGLLSGFSATRTVITQ